jgi:hypothetical protein
MISSSRMDRTRFKSREDEIDYRLIYGISFAVFLVMALGARMIDWSGPAHDTTFGKRQSVFMQARSNASSAAAFAFMQ